MTLKQVLKTIEYTFYVLIIITAVVASVYIIQNGIENSISQIQTFISTAGIWGSFFFISVQILQVIVPMIPGGAVHASGVILFGPLEGFILNMVGVLTGSIIAFFLARRFGLRLVSAFFDQELINRYQNKIDNFKHLNIGLTAAIALPGFPDDLLVYLTGIMTKMSVVSFIQIMVIGRGLSIGFYSIGIDNLLRILQNIIS